MKRLFRRLLASVLACVIVLSVSACGSSDKPAAAESTADSNQASTQDSRKYTINYVIQQAVPPDPDGELVVKWQEKYNVQFNITNLDPIQGATQLNLKIASGETPDVFSTSTNSMVSFQQQGALAEIPEDFITKYLPKVSQELEAEVPGVMKFGMLDGKRYGIPNAMFWYNEMRRPIVYNGLWMQKAGITKAPETIGELETLLTKFAQSDPDGNGKKDTYGISDTAIPLVYGSFGTDRNMWIDNGGKAEYSSIQPVMKDALQLLNKWYKEGIIDPQFITGENTGGYWAITQAFITGRIGLTAIGTFYHWSPALPGRQEGQDLTEIKKANANLADNLVFGPVIKGDDGKGGVSTSPIARDGYLVFGSQLNKDPDKMARILAIADDMCGNIDNYIDFFYGIKGKDWETNADGSYKFNSNEPKPIPFLSSFPALPLHIG